MLLITGFEPFGSHRNNPSQHLLEQLQRDCPNPSVDYLLLPVSYERAAPVVLKRRIEIDAHTVVMFGLAAGSTSVRLEQFAHNLDDSTSLDNDQRSRPRKPIDPDAAAAYRSSLPLEQMAQLAEHSGCPVEYSRDAGGYVCNHTFFRVAHGLSSTAVRCGFVHIPDTPSGSTQLNGLSLLVADWIELLSESP